MRTLSGRTIERSYLGRRAASKKRKRTTKRRARPIVRGVAAGGRTARSATTLRARRLGEAPLTRKGLPQRRPVGRRT